MSDRARAEKHFKRDANVLKRRKMPNTHRLFVVVSIFMNEICILLIS